MSAGKNSEGRLESKEEQLAESKRVRNIAFLTGLFGILLVAGSYIVSHTPSITNEVLQEMAGIVLSIIPLMCLYIGINVLVFFSFRNKAKKLSRQIGQVGSEKNEKKNETDSDT